jgi:hypothetical protein
MTTLGRWQSLFPVFIYTLYIYLVCSSAIEPGYFHTITLLSPIFSGTSSTAAEWDNDFVFGRKCSENDSRSWAGTWPTRMLDNECTKQNKWLHSISKCASRKISAVQNNHSQNNMSNFIMNGTCPHGYYVSVSGFGCWGRLVYQYQSRLVHHLPFE